MVEAMASRQHKNNLSELGVNWLGNGHLNASESDIMYKYHVVRAATTLVSCLFFQHVPVCIETANDALKLLLYSE